MFSLLILLLFAVGRVLCDKRETFRWFHFAFFVVFLPFRLLQRPGGDFDGLAFDFLLVHCFVVVVVVVVAVFVVVFVVVAVVFVVVVNVGVVALLVVSVRTIFSCGQ